MPWFEEEQFGVQDAPADQKLTDQARGLRRREVAASQERAARPQYVGDRRVLAHTALAALLRWKEAKEADANGEVGEDVAEVMGDVKRRFGYLLERTYDRLTTVEQELVDEMDEFDGGTYR